MKRSSGIVLAVIFHISSAHVTMHYQQQVSGYPSYSRVVSGQQQQQQQQAMTPGVTLHPVPSSHTPPWWPPRHEQVTPPAAWRFIPFLHTPLTVVHHHVIHSHPHTITPLATKTTPHKVHPTKSTSTPRIKLEPPPTPPPKNISREEFPERRVTESPPASTISVSSEGERSVESAWRSREDEESSEENFPRPFRGY